jgi:hypothetical protein
MNRLPLPIADFQLKAALGESQTWQSAIENWK